MKLIYKTTALLLLSVAVSACGAKDSLYLPEEKAAAKQQQEKPEKKPVQPDAQQE